MTATIIIVGAGQAGAQAIHTLRSAGYTGGLALVGDEPELPYQRPPLSKRFLAGDLALERMLLRHRAFYEEHRVELHLGVRALSLDAALRRVHLSDGRELPYDRLLLCLGGAARRLACPGAELGGVHYLRSLTDAAALRRDLGEGARAVIIGGGYIGLETAATCSLLGRAATGLFPAAGLRGLDGGFECAADGGASGGPADAADCTGYGFPLLWVHESDTLARR